MITPDDGDSHEMSVADIKEHLIRFVVSTRVTWNVWDPQVTSIIAHFPEPRYVSPNNRLVSKKLATLIKSMCTKAGLQGNFSNHSGKRTCATSLFHEGFDEQIVSSRTGRRSTAIRDNKVPSDKQQFALSKILDPPTANMVSTMTLHDTDDDSDERRAKIPCTC